MFSCTAIPISTLWNIYSISAYRCPQNPTPLIKNTGIIENKYQIQQCLFVHLSSNQVSGWVVTGRGSALWAHLGCSVCWGWRGRAGTVLCPETTRTRAVSEWSSTRSSWTRWKGAAAAAAWGCDSGLTTHTHGQIANRDQWREIHTHSVHRHKKGQKKKGREG